MTSESSLSPELLARMESKLTELMERNARQRQWVVEPSMVAAFIAILFAVWGVGFSALNTNINDLRDDIQENKEEINRVKEDINSVKEDINIIKEDIKDLNYKLDQVLDNLSKRQ